MIVGGQTEARAQLSSTIIDYHATFDQGFTLSLTYLSPSSEARRQSSDEVARASASDVTAKPTSQGKLLERTFRKSNLKLALAKQPDADRSSELSPQTLFFFHRKPRLKDVRAKIF